MSENITTEFDTTPSVPFYKNKKLVITAVAVTAAVAVMAVLKFKSTDTDEETVEHVEITSDTTSKK